MADTPLIQPTTPITVPAVPAKTFDALFATQIHITKQDATKPIKAIWSSLPLNSTTDEINFAATPILTHCDDVLAYIGANSPGGQAMAQAYGALVIAMNLYMKEKGVIQ